MNGNYGGFAAIPKGAWEWPRPGRRNTAPAVPAPAPGEPLRYALTARE
jgi:hypothetical protein